MLGWFMWMFGVELEDGALIDVYKHGITRRYLHLDHGGRAFYYTGGGRYRQVGWSMALAAVFDGSEWNGGNPAHPNSTPWARGSSSE